MAEVELPLPVTREEQYLQAILDELRALRSDKQAQRPSATPEGLTELREPVKPPTPAAKPHRKKGRRVR